MEIFFINNTVVEKILYVYCMFPVIDRLIAKALLYEKVQLFVLFGTYIIILIREKYWILTKFQQISFSFSLHHQHSRICKNVHNE